LHARAKKVGELQKLRQETRRHILIELRIFPRMCEPANAEPLPHVLGRQIVEMWLDAHSVAILDRAHCSKESRRRFHELLSDACLRNVITSIHSDRAGKVFNAPNLIRWLQKRNMEVESFVVPQSLLTDREALLPWMKRVGRSVTSVSFQVGWRVKKLGTAFSDIANCFPNLATIDVSELTFGDSGQRTALNQGLRAVIPGYDLHTIVATRTDLDNETMAVIAQHCPHLQHLDVRECRAVTGPAVSSIAQSCPALVYLDINATLVDAAAVASIAEHCPLLQHLDIANIKVPGGCCVALVQACPHLVYFACRETTGPDIEAIAEFCPNLQALIIAKTSAGDYELESLAESCTHLRVLDLSSPSFISDAALDAVAEHCKDLQDLCLSGCFDIRDYGVHEILFNCHQLRKLQLRGCDGLSDGSAEAIANYGKNLTYLDVERCLGISVEGIRLIGKHCTKLRTVSCKRDGFEHENT
jgi:hypothetical protein